MKTKTSSLSVAAACVAIATMPVASEAKSGPDAAVDACVKSFVTTYLPDRTVRPFKSSATTPSPLSFFYWGSRDYTVQLTAHGVDSGKVIAEARCVASRNGIVVVLDTPLTARNRERADFIVSLR